MSSDEDLLGLSMLRQRYVEGDRFGPTIPCVIGFRAVVTSSEALSVAANILSFATCVTGVALLPRRQVPPLYHVPDSCSCEIRVRLGSS